MNHPPRGVDDDACDIDPEVVLDRDSRVLVEPQFLGALHQEPPPWQPETLARVKAEWEALAPQVEAIPDPPGPDPWFFLRGRVEDLRLDEIEQGKTLVAEFERRLAALRARIEAGD